MNLRVAMLSIHTCPLAALGAKETGGMNVYVRELCQGLSRLGVTTDIFTRRQDPNLPNDQEFVTQLNLLGQAVACRCLVFHLFRQVGLDHQRIDGAAAHEQRKTSPDDHDEGHEGGGDAPDTMRVRILTSWHLDILDIFNMYDGGQENPARGGQDAKNSRTQDVKMPKMTKMPN